MKKLIYLILWAGAFISIKNSAGLASAGPVYPQKKTVRQEVFFETRTENFGSDWEITFGKSWGRSHQNIILQTVKSNGQITYVNKRGAVPFVGKISEKEVNEITELINRMKISQARALSPKEFNNCIVSPHLPSIYFSLTINNRRFNLRHCNKTPGFEQKYDYTLDLLDSQKSAYKILREKLESLFSREMKEQAAASK